jgi:hypothetical protein
VVGNHGGVSLQSRPECLETERSRLVVDGKGSVGKFAKLSPLLAQLLHRRDRSTKTAEAASLTDGCGEFYRIPWAEGRANDRDADAEQFTETSSHEIEGANRPAPVAIGSSPH